MKLIDILVEELPKRGGWPAGVSDIEQASDGMLFEPCNYKKPYLFNDHIFGLSDDWNDALITRKQYEAALAEKENPLPWDEKKTDADGWIDWAGGKCPVEKGTLVDVKLRNGLTATRQTALEKGDFASHAFWRCDGNGADIIAYRLHQPQEVEMIPLDECDGSRVEDDLNECIGQQTPWNGEGLPPVGCGCEWEDRAEWIPVKIKYLSEWVIVFSGITKDGEEVDIAKNLYADDVKFRPLRSEADKKRDAAIEAIDWYMPECILDTPNEFYHAKKIYDAIAAGKIPGVKLEV